MLNGLFSLIGLSWGNGGVTMFNDDAPVSVPPYGTVISTYYTYEYPIAQGGSYFTYNAGNYPNQTVTVDLIADGAGGSIINWANVRDLSYKAYGVVFSATNGTYTINIYGTDYTSGSYTADVVHDGTGYFTFTNYVNSFTPYGTYITSVTEPHTGGNILEVPTGSGTYYPTGTWDGYEFYHDGSGGYYSVDIGFTSYSYGHLYITTQNSTDVPTESGNYYLNGTNSDYISDGMGGYTVVGSGSYYSYGTIIFDSIYYPTGSQIEIPYGSANYFYQEWYGDRYYWDGAGYYYNVTSNFYYPYGTYITNDGTYSYYWDGNGGYYNS